MRKILLPLIVCVLFPLIALADGLSITFCPETIRPGKTERISFNAPAAGSARLELFTDSGVSQGVIREGFSALAGTNHMTWNGTLEGAIVPEGDYILSLTVEQDTFRKPLHIGAVSPQILSVQADDALLPGGVWNIAVQVNMPGTLAVSLKLEDGQWITILEQPAAAGDNHLAWNGVFEGEPIPQGRYPVQLKLTDETGFAGTAQQVNLNIQPPVAAAVAPSAANRLVIPSAVTTQADENNYWTLPVGVMDEAAIWEIMMQPIVVLDSSKMSNKNEKDVYQLRKTPDNTISKENVVGEITYDSQGVHVLETLDNGWTLVESYNSSYGPNCASRRGYGVTDDLIQGYVKTNLLKTVTPRTEYGLLVDKLEQKMYIFSAGKCIGTLLVSTGLNNETQSWNETPSGEFLMISRMGGFPAGNLWCAYGMRVNGGCAMHEVPYIGNEDTPTAYRDYSSTVKLLGKKASHGCIRIQKAANEQGQNIKWLWDNIKVNTKVLIWDDTGRFLDYPDPQTKLYYNPNGGKNYHEDQYCSAVKDRYLPLTAFTYEQLHSDSKFTKLTPCPSCARIMRREEIDAVNKENGF